MHTQYVRKDTPDSIRRSRAATGPFFKKNSIVNKKSMVCLWNNCKKKTPFDVSFNENYKKDFSLKKLC